MKTIKFLGVVLLVVAAALVAVPVMAGFSMAGFHVGMVIFCGLAGMLCFLV